MKAKRTYIYIVTSGEYSGYSINAVYSAKAEAQKYVDTYRWQGKHEIEKWELNPPWPDATTELDVIMGKDGTVYDVNKHCIYPGRESAGKRISFFTGMHLYVPSLGRALGTSELLLRWRVATDDEKRAVKVINEKRMQILALGIWGNTRKVEEMIAQN